MCFLNLVEIGWIRSLGNFDNSKYAKISNLVFPMNRNTKSCSIQFSEKDNLIIKSYSKFNLEENNYKVNNLPKLSKNLYLLQWFQCMATYKSEHDFHLTRSLTSLFRYHYRIKNKMFNAKNCWEVRRNYYKEHFTDFFYFGGCVAVVLERWKQLFYNPWQGHSSVLRLHCFYLSLALSPCFAHSLTLSLSLSHTHTHTKQRQQQQRGINHFFSDRMKVMMPVFFCLLVRGHHFACHVAMVNICRLYKNVFPCACVCLCVCVYVCARARASTIAAFLKIKIPLVYRTAWSL